MMAQMKRVHEPEAELHSAEEAIQDAARLRQVLEQHRAERIVSVQVPLWALLEALDSLQPNELYEVVQRAQERLAASKA